MKFFVLQFWFYFNNSDYHPSKQKKAGTVPAFFMGHDSRPNIVDFPEVIPDKNEDQINQ